MTFEEVYSKIQDGTATDEEKAFFEGEVGKLEKLETLLGSIEPPHTGAAGDGQSKFAEADFLTVQKARKVFNTKLLIRVIIITVSSLLLIAAIVCGIIFIPSLTSAKRNLNVDKDEAIELAKTCLKEFTGTEMEGYFVHDVDRELEINGRLTSAVYTYEIEFRNPDRNEYEVTVNAKSGYAVVTDVDLVKPKDKAA